MTETYTVNPFARPAPDPQSPKDAAARAEARPGFSAVPMGPLLDVAAAHMIGAAKYGRHNWREAPVRASVYFDAAMRHLCNWYEGQNRDPESGLPSLAHAIASLLIAMDADRQGTLVDDRPPGVRGAEADDLRERLAHGLARAVGGKAVPAPATRKGNAGAGAADV